MAKTLLLVFLLPPMNLAVLTLAGLLMAGRWPRLGRALGLVGAVGLLLLAMPAVSGAMLSALERDLPTTPPADDPPAAIVVLSGDAMRTISVPGQVVVGILTVERLRTAAALARRTGLPLLVTGGTVREDKVPVARLMAESLTEEFGLPVRWTEEAARDTWENARFSAAILREAGIRSVYVVTHGWHMRRAVMAFAATGIAVTAAPTPLQWVAPPKANDFVPRVSSWLDAYFALHEWVGIAWYAIR
ncbi:MAG: YdcF family protein [Acetobacteraceae bacterium]